MCLVHLLLVWMVWILLHNHLLLLLLDLIIILELLLMMGVLLLILWLIGLGLLLLLIMMLIVKWLVCLINLDRRTISLSNNLLTLTSSTNLIILCNQLLTLFLWRTVYPQLILLALLWISIPIQKYPHLRWFTLLQHRPILHQFILIC